MKKKIRNCWIVKWLIFGGRPDWVDRGVIYKTKIEFNNKGFYDIKIGDKFEGAACGNWFDNQICTGINGDVVYGTTTCAVFRKEFIRPLLPTNNDPETLIYSNI